MPSRLITPTHNTKRTVIQPAAKPFSPWKRKKDEHIYILHSSFVHNLKKKELHRQVSVILRIIGLISVSNTLWFYRLNSIQISIGVSGDICIVRKFARLSCLSSFSSKTCFFEGKYSNAVVVYWNYYFNIYWSTLKCICVCFRSEIQIRQWICYCKK